MLSQPVRQRLGPVSQSLRADSLSPKGFLPVRPTQKPLDYHVRKPPGADACGDVVSVELLQNATTLVFSSVGLESRGSAVAAGPALRPPSEEGACPLSGIRIWRFEPSLRRKSYLVDPASSHMLVSKIKPCMSKYMPY